MRRLGFDVFQIDECTFNIKSFQDRHWAKRREPFRIKKRYESKPLVMVCGAISEHTGVGHMLIVEKSATKKGLDQHDIIKMLIALREKVPENLLAAFLDQASTHCALAVRLEA